MSMNLSSIKPAYRLLENPTSPVERVAIAHNQRYPVVTEAIKMQRVGGQYEIQKYDHEQGKYVRDEIGHKAVFERADSPFNPNRKTGKTRTSVSADNPELRNAFKDLATVANTCASEVKTGHFTEQMRDEFTQECLKVMFMSGVEVGHLRQILRNMQQPQESHQ